MKRNRSCRNLETDCEERSEEGREEEQVEVEEKKREEGGNFHLE